MAMEGWCFLALWFVSPFFQRIENLGYCSSLISFWNECHYNFIFFKLHHVEPDCALLDVNAWEDQRGVCVCVGDKFCNCSGPPTYSYYSPLMVGGSQDRHLNCILSMNGSNTLHVLTFWRGVMNEGGVSDTARQMETSHSLLILNLTNYYIRPVFLLNLMSLQNLCMGDFVEKEVFLQDWSWFVIKIR